MKKWIDIPDPARHDKFISDWHAYLKKQEEILENDSSDESRKAVSMGILNTFYCETMTGQGISMNSFTKD